MRDTEPTLSDRRVPQLSRFDTEQVRPDRASILALQGVPSGHRLSEVAERLVADAIEETVRLADPQAVSLELTPSEFRFVLEGEGHNSTPNPVEEVAARADHSRLFILTLGLPISRRIASLFEGRDPALGCTLDVAASAMAERVADRLQAAFEWELSEASGARSKAVMRYSPGYCGWHLSGQRRLFSALDASSIGVSINESCLMIPIKSISGVMLAGEPRIHFFKNDYAFCEECQTKNCRERIRELSRR